MSMDSDTILVTGATGFLGREIAHRLLVKQPGARLLLPARSKGGRTAEQRALTAVAGTFPPAQRDAVRPRLEVFEADLSSDRMGLSRERFEALATRTTRIVHAAADVHFDRPLAEARRSNVGGVKAVLSWARSAQQAGAFRGLTHVSTAFVAGDRTGTLPEDELDVGQRFHNSYEQSKCEAEKLVRDCWTELPALVVRPSIIVGDSRTGMTTSFKAMYWPLKIYASGRWRLVPGCPDAVADIVPVDFVADATAELACNDQAAARCYHLCAGPEGNATVQEMAAMAAHFFDLPPPRFVNPALFLTFIRPLLVLFLWGPKRKILKTGRVYRPYFSMRGVFDTRNARQFLAPAGITAPPVSDYITRLFEYCLVTEWGQRPYRQTGDSNKHIRNADVSRAS